MVDLPPEQADARKWRIALRLREARQKQSPKLSQAALARRVNETGLAYFQSTHASRLECGYLDATWKEVQAIARVLNVTDHWLANQASDGAQPAPRAQQPVRQASPAPAPAPIASGLAAAAARAAPAVATKPVANAEEADSTMPAPTLLAQGGRTAYEFRQGLVDTLARATAMLHQPGLPARSWRAWRDVERQVRELLRRVATD